MTSRSILFALGPELLAISPDSKPWRNLAEILAGSAGFRASGQKLVSVSFDSDVIHRFGNVVVMFSRYTVVTEGNGKRETQAGRATEVFVRSNGRWVHTSWHLDIT
ncbi:MAG TPA: nuclear transport factor 2 family protein [Gemmatimonadaceae bacterium]|nr:nuclear transport factor 2 family protein [Gemmatimonadaceae bacterium]